MAPRKKHIDHLLTAWPFDPSQVGVRLVKGKDGRDVIQMRIDMGLLQLEAAGRPDGVRPKGYETYYEFLQTHLLDDDDQFQMSEDQCGEIDREFVQFYHRRICWLTLQQYPKVVQDADHTLGMMDFCLKYSTDEEWTMSHEQYRPFVLFHRTQAAAMAELDDDQAGPETAIQRINDGLERFRTFFAQYDAGEHFEDDDLVKRLIELRESLRDQFEIGRTLQEQLVDAVALEQYEAAAKIRDELAKRSKSHH